MSQALREPVRSGCSEPENPVCFGVGTKNNRRVVQFASFTFNDAVLDIASSEIQESADDDPGSAVWRVLASNPIQELCVQDLAKDLKDAQDVDRKNGTTPKV